MKTSATLTMEFSDARARRSLAEVLAPDNRELPRGLSLRAAGGAKTIELTVESESHSTSLSTALAILRDVTLFEEVWLLSRPKRG